MTSVVPKSSMNHRGFSPASYIFLLCGTATPFPVGQPFLAVSLPPAKWDSRSWLCAFDCFFFSRARLQSCRRVRRNHRGFSPASYIFLLCRTAIPGCSLLTVLFLPSSCVGARLAPPVSHVRRTGTWCT